MYKLTIEIQEGGDLDEAVRVLVESDLGGRDLDTIKIEVVR